MGNDNSVYFDYPVKLTSRSDIALAASLHSDIIAAGRGGYGIKTGNIKDSFVPYDITVTYHLKSGGTETRYYDRTTLGVLQKMLVLDTADSMKKNFSTLISGQPVTNGFGIYQVSSFSSLNVTLLDSWYQNPVKLTLTQAEHTGLLGCISRDVAGQTLDDRYFPKGPPVCILSFGSVGNGDFEAGSYRYDFGESYVYVTGGFTNTINYLKQHGLAGSLSYTPKIESITLAGYVPSYSYAKLYNDGNYPESPFVMGFAATGEEAGFKLQSTVAITDSAEIGTLTPLLRNDYFMSGGGYMAMIKLEGSKNYVYKLLPAADAPTFVSARLSPEGRKS